MGAEPQEIRKRITLTNVVARIKQNAIDNYDNKIYDNVLPIYNDLSIRERKVLLRGLINLLFLVEQEVNTPMDEDTDITERQKEREHLIELKNIKDDPNDENGKFKSWFFKVLFVISIMVFVIVFITFFFLDINFAKYLDVIPRVYNAIIGAI